MSFMAAVVIDVVYFRGDLSVSIRLNYLCETLLLLSFTHPYMTTPIFCCCDLDTFNLRKKRTFVGTGALGTQFTLTHLLSLRPAVV